MNAIEKQLLTTPAADWETEQLVVFDWYDGPIEGFCKLKMPEAYFHFRMFASLFRHDDVDDRLYEIIFLTYEEWSSLLATLTQNQKMVHPVWIPEPFVRGEPDAIAFLVGSKETSQLLIQSEDMRIFKGCWERQ